MRVRSVVANTPATRLLKYTPDGRVFRFRLEPGDYIVDINGHPIGLHDGYYCEFSDLLSHAASHPELPEDYGWVNLGVFDPETLRIEEYWVNLN